jgi:probable phosphoglycerate mutase
LAVVARILLVRHGQSEWNAQARWQGLADIELSDLGRAQAKAAATALGSFDLIAASTLQRARDTAAIIAEQLGIGPVLPVPALVERDAGEWSGLTRTDIERDWPGYLAENRRPPGWEDDHAFRTRIINGLTDVARMLPDRSGEALVVAHGGLIYALEDLTNRRGGRIGNLGAIWLDVAADGTIDVGDRVTLIDDALGSAQSRELL